MNICIAYPKKDLYSETFIRAHVNYMPADRVFELNNGYWLPLYDGISGKKVIKQWRTRTDKYLSKVFGKKLEIYQNGAIKNYFGKYQIKAVLAEYGPTGEALFRSCTRSRIPLIVHFHGFDAYRNNIIIDDKYNVKYPEMFEKSAALIAVSNDMRQQLISLGAPAKKIHVNPCGVDVDLFDKTNPERNPPTFVSTGRFVSKKAHYLSILAFKHVVSHVPDARLVIMGTGPLYEVCKRMVDGLGLEKHIELPGAVSQDEVLSRLTQARAFVLHSVRSYDNDSEGTPVSVLEASSMGLPVVSTMHAGIKEAVDDNKTGFLVEEGDVAGMTQKMLVLARDPGLCRSMGEAGRQKMISKFSMKDRIESLWQIISGCVRQ